MKKNKVYPVLLLYSLMMITACQRENVEVDKKTEISDTAENTPYVKKGNFSEEKLDLNSYSLGYKEGTDFQSFFEWSYAAKSENGYYFWDDNYAEEGMLMFYDEASGVTVPLCNLPNCKHGKDGNYDSCNAYFNQNTEIRDYFYRWGIQYFEGDLYMTGCDKEDCVNIYKVAKDGSSREVSCKLYKLESSDGSSAENHGIMPGRAPSVCIHRGYAYFINNDESVLRIRKVKLNSKEEPQVVYETSGIRPNLYRMEGYGDYIFFQTGNFTDETYENMEGGIYAYNIVTGTISLVKKDAVSSYIVQGTMLYYSTDTTVNQYDLLSQKDEEFVKIEEAYPTVMADSNYIYITYNDNTIHVYNKDKSEISTIMLEHCLAYFYGDDKYLFAMCSDGIKIMDKSTLKDDKKEWISTTKE